MSEFHDPMAAIQEMGHGLGYDYVSGSPHLRHEQLRTAIVRRIDRTVREIVAQQGQCRVLEVGGGHGTFTDVVLGAGGTVVVTEMSQPSADYLADRYSKNPDVTVVRDPDGDEPFRRGDSVDLVLYVSVLHHIPDYLGAVSRAAQELVRPGGGVLAFQDPLWYPRQSRTALAVSSLAYFTWRLGQGNVQRGMQTRLRRLQGVYDEGNPADMVEYHVVRQGVDDQALVAALRPMFDHVGTVEYFSTQMPLLHRFGTRFCPPNTFALTATGRKTNQAT